MAVRLGPMAGRSATPRKACVATAQRRLRPRHLRVPSPPNGRLGCHAAKEAAAFAAIFRVSARVTATQGCRKGAACDLSALEAPHAPARAVLDVQHVGYPSVILPGRGENVQSKTEIGGLVLPGHHDLSPPVERGGNLVMQLATEQIRWADDSVDSHPGRRRGSLRGLPNLRAGPRAAGRRRRAHRDWRSQHGCAGLPPGPSPTLTLRPLRQFADASRSECQQAAQWPPRFSS